MDEIERKIIEQLAKEEKMKAKQIAKKLNVTRREVNQCLYYKSLYFGQSQHPFSCKVQLPV